ncbi:MAG: CPBP family intramembrane glutamic endopeptidase [Bacillota bacterium]
MTTRVVVLTAFASILADVIARETLGFVPTWLTLTKIAILLVATVHYARIGNRQLARYAGVLLALVAFSHGSAYLGRTAAWQAQFDMNSFTGHFGSMVSLKFLSIIPLTGLLLLLFRPPRRAYVAVGDLSARAEPIRWLGIKADCISWGRLAVYSAFAIAGGTLLLTLITVTGFAQAARLGELRGCLPVILLLALVNSVSEGFMFRNAILAPLRDVLPKAQVLLVAAGFFGMAHFYGAPSGVLGVFMSGALGWYMSRSMYETGGLVSSWIIHFVQDTVIFTTLMLLSQSI